MKLAENISIEYKKFTSDRTFTDVDSLIVKENKAEYSRFNYYFELEETGEVVIFGRITTFDDIDVDTGKVYREFSMNTSTVDKKTKVLTHHTDGISLDTYEVLNNLPVWTFSELMGIGVKSAEKTPKYAFQALRIARERQLNN